MNSRIAWIDPRAHAEHLARFLVGDQVHIALAVLLLLVGQAVELLRQRAQRLGQQAQPGYADRQLAGFGLEQRALRRRRCRPGPSA